MAVSGDQNVKLCDALCDQIVKKEWIQTMCHVCTWEEHRTFANSIEGREFSLSVITGYTIFSAP